MIVSSWHLSFAISEVFTHYVAVDASFAGSQMYMAVLQMQLHLSCLQDPSTRAFDSRATYYGNSVVSGVLLVLLLSNLLVFAWRVVQAHWLGKIWSAPALTLHAFAINGSSFKRYAWPRMCWELGCQLRRICCIIR